MCGVMAGSPLWSHFRFPDMGGKRVLLVFPAQWCKCKSGKGGGLNFASECDRAGGVQTRIHVRDCFIVTDHGTQLEKGLWGHPGWGGGERCLISAGVHACWRLGVSRARWKARRWWLSPGVHFTQPVFGAAVWDRRDLVCGHESDYLRCVENKSCDRGGVRGTKKPGYWKDRMCILCKFNPRDI